MRIIPSLNSNIEIHKFSIFDEIDDVIDNFKF